LGESIAVVPELPLILPRGKFDVHFLKNALKIHGPSHDYKIPYKNILKAFLLPKPDGVHINFVLSLSSALRGQGNTNYPFLVFQFKNKNEKSIQLSHIEKYPGLKSPIEGELFDIMAKLFKHIINIGVIIPGSFKNSKNSSSLKCSLKTNEGYLYPLERGLIFIHKPVAYISLEEIKQVECSRITETNVQHKSFDICIKTIKEEYQFQGIEKTEFDPLIKYFHNKKVKVKNIDEGNKEIKHVPNTTTSRRQRPIEDVPMELPSESEMDGDYSEDGDNDMEVDDESESEKKTKKRK
jgi:structure-specific recognition protein 1